MLAYRSAAQAYLYIAGDISGTISFGAVSIPTTLGVVKVTFTTGATDASVTLGALISGPVIGYWIKFSLVQLELKPYKTSYISGTRAAETLTIPTTGVLNQNEGTVELKFYVPFLTSSSVYIFDHNPTGNNKGRLLIYGSISGGLTAIMGDGTTFVTSNGIPCQVGWNYIALRWGSFGVKLTVNNTTVVKSGVSKLSPIVAINMYLGSFSGGTYQAAGAVYDDFRVSNLARFDADILAAYNSGRILPIDQYTNTQLVRWILMQIY